MMLRWKSALVLGLLLGLSAKAEVRPHALFTDGLVLQQKTAAPIWGTARDGEEITVRFEAATTVEVKTTARDGKWKVALNGLEPGGPFKLTIAGDNTITLPNVFVGEVWICSGQSNMEWSVQASANPDEVASTATNPKIRLFSVPHRGAETPQENVNARWVECNPQTVRGFSAVGYAFGRKLAAELNVPVGLINNAVGGSAAEAWTSRQVLEGHPQLKPYVERNDREVKEFNENPPKEKRKGKGKRQGQPDNPAMRLQVRVAACYNGLLAPLQPYAIRGVIWYQGESNAGRAHNYLTLFPTMIENWRRDWNSPKLPFLFVQLAPFMKKTTEPGESAWAELREAQRLTAKTVPHTGMAVITDVGDENDIHPKQKEPVGTRLALIALANVYQKDCVWSGPEYDGMSIEGSKAIIRFKHTGGGLVAKNPDDRVTGFTIAGADKKFHNAEAKIEGNTVVVSCPDVAAPVAVRFGWANFPIVNLFNKEGLPASPFKTDDFAWTTARN